MTVTAKKKGKSMKKKTLPKKIKVAGMQYDILYPHEFYKPSGYLGLHNGVGLTIKVGRGPVKEGSLAEGSVIDTLLHELLHAVDFWYCNHILNEDFVVLLTACLIQVVSDNDLNIMDASHTPKVIKVLGNRFAIENTNDFSDTNGLCYFIEWETNTIFSGMESDGLKFNDQYRNFLVFCAMFDCILNTVCSDSLLEEFTKQVNKRSFVSGLFQVFHDNDLEKIIKEWVNE